jgi:hypothetical protein
MIDKSNDQPIYPRVEPVLSAVAQWVRKHRSATSSRDELAECAPADVARIASEIGISHRELDHLASRGPGAADLLQKLLVALHVDPETTTLKDPAVMHDLQRLCITCSHKKQCQHDLAAGTAAQEYQKYCPNAFTLEAILKERK